MWIAIFLTFLGTRVGAQELYTLNLEEVVDIARSASPDMKLAETRLNNSLWRYRSFRADYKPQISRAALLPG